MEVLAYGIFQCCYFYSVRSNLVLLFDALTPFSTQIPTVVRLLFVVRYRKHIKLLLDYLKNAFENGLTLDPKFLPLISFFFSVTDLEEKKIMAIASRFSFLMLSILLVFGYITDFFFVAFPACKDIYRKIQGMDRRYELPFKAM